MTCVSEAESWWSSVLVLLCFHQSGSFLCSLPRSKCACTYKHTHTHTQSRIWIHHKIWAWHSSMQIKSVFSGNNPLRIWLCAITVSANALLSCYGVVQTLSYKLLVFTDAIFGGLRLPSQRAVSGMFGALTGAALEPKACAFKRQEKRFSALPFHRIAHLDLFCQGYTTVLNCTVPITTPLPQLTFLSVFLPVPVIFPFSLFCFVLPCFKPLQPLLMWICKSP